MNTLPVTNTSKFAEFLATTLFVLGASDPEMNGIELALASLGQQGFDINVKTATVNGVQVTPGNAYAADGMFAIISSPDQGWVRFCFVECEVASLSRDIVIDHHREGDYGHALPPEQFWEASSIGQLYRLFLANGASPAVLDDCFPSNKYLVAASDHCPSHAFSGLCPGICVDDLLRFRAETSAAFNKMSVGEWLAVVQSSIQKLRTLPVTNTPYGGYSVAEKEIPLLNHASLAAGVAVQYVIPGNARDPRTKVGLLGGSPELIRYWMKTSKLDVIYGSPERGYAGGYVV